MLREAPLSDDFERFPRFAGSAAPAAICCFFDFAGIHKQFASRSDNGLASQRASCAEPALSCATQPPQEIDWCTT